MSTLLNRTYQIFKSGLAVVGVAAAVTGYMEYKQLFPLDDDDDKKKKNRVLVIPFNRLNIVEKNNDSPMNLKSFSDIYRYLFSQNAETIEVRELVDLLHHAASDPTIVSVYGVFGHGGMGKVGWAQLEEIRNALQVVKESHRRHTEPNFTYETKVDPKIHAKPMYAYSDTFQYDANGEYYLASVFNHVYMQEQGGLNFFGVALTQMFVREFLDKHGIQVHVFKHGHYKNAPNMFTHKSFSRHHFENASNLVKSIGTDACHDITISRADKLSSKWLTKKGKAYDSISLWNRIYETGSFPGESAVNAGFIDALLRRDPLQDLVDSNNCSNNNNNDDDIKSRWEPSIAIADTFPGQSMVSLNDYSKEITSKKRSNIRKKYWEQKISGNSFLDGIVSCFNATKNEEIKNSTDHIALLHVDGLLTDVSADDLLRSIQNIRNDSNAKCVVVRVSSEGGSPVACEKIKQDLEALNLPIVFSFGNISASGGYYIATAASRIFSSNKSITGSIGVFGIRFDITGLAAKYGIKFEHISSSDLSGTYDFREPMTPKMKQIFSNEVDRTYTHFKKIVSESRKLPLNNVESVAQGRIWTGAQAKSLGLVDEIGGLHRALAYARRNYTSNIVTDGSDIIVYQKTYLQKFLDGKMRKGIFEMLTLQFETGGKDVSAAMRNAKTQRDFSPYLSGVLMVSNEDTGIRFLVQNSKNEHTPVSTFFPDFFWE